MSIDVTKVPQVTWFLLVAPPVAYYTNDGEPIVVVGLICSLLHLAYHRGSRLTALFTAAACSGMILQNKSRWYLALNDAVLGLGCAAALSTIYYEIISKSGVTAVRRLMFVIVISAALCTTLFQFRELVKLLENNSDLTVYESTIRANNCDDSVGSGNSFIVVEQSFTASCPRIIWEYVRNNIMLIIQAYVLLMLTTEVHQMDKISGSALAMFEGAVWSIASVLQFNHLKACYALKWSATVALFIAITAHLVRTLQNGAKKPAVAVIENTCDLKHAKIKL